MPLATRTLRRPARRATRARRKPVDIDPIVNAVAVNFRSFGGGQTSEWNPLVNALSDQPPQFAAGVDIREVVEFVVKRVR